MIAKANAFYSKKNVCAFYLKTFNTFLDLEKISENTIGSNGSTSTSTLLFIHITTIILTIYLFHTTYLDDDTVVEVFSGEFDNVVTTLERGERMCGGVPEKKIKDINMT